MQLSEKPTSHILVGADTNDSWCSCDFAVITISEQWKQDQLRRLEVVRSFADDSTFRTLSFENCSVYFFHSDRSGQPDLKELLGDRNWAFVEVSPEELSEEELPEEEQINCNLDAYRLVIDFDGDVKYTAFGEYSGGEFWTEEFPLQELLKQL